MFPDTAWVLLSSEWISAREANEMGLVWRLCPPGDVLTVATEHAARVARLPISSMRAVKRTMVEPLAAVAEGRPADFTSLPDGA